MLTNKTLPALYNAMYANNIRVEERDILFTAVNLFIVKILADIEPFFQKLYLRKADKTNCLALTVYNSAQNFAEKMKDIATPSADLFKERLRFDDNGNLLCNIPIKGNNHTLTLNHPYKHQRNVSEEQRLQNVKDSLTSLKMKITENMVENIKNQCSDDTYYYSWLGLDLEIPGLSIQDRIDRMNDLFAIYCTEKIHPVSKYSNNQETELSVEKYFGYVVYLQYPKIDRL